MSYARFSENSNVYVYDDVGGYLCCCGCLLGDRWDFHSVGEMVSHLQEHVAAGHKVPAYLFDPETFSDCTFTAMCPIFMCREDIGHQGDHTPLSDRMREQGLRIRVKEMSDLQPNL